MPPQYTPPAIMPAATRPALDATLPSADAWGHQRRIAELDGLRGMAVALIVLLHYVVRTAAGVEVLQRLPRPLWALLDMSWWGVDLFFVISGFLIGGILLDHRESPRLLRVFYVRRACRILPLYLLLLAIAFSPAFGGGSAPGAATVPPYSYLLFAQNIWTSLGATPRAWLTPAWSVAIEEQFYLVAPFAVVLLSRRALLRGLLACVVIAPLLRAASVEGLVPFSSWDFTLCRFDAPAYGVLGALFVRDPRGMAALRRHAGSLPRVLPFLLAGCVGFSQVPLMPWGDAAVFTVGLSYFAITALVLVLGVQYCPDSFVARLARTAALVRVGQRSYFLYLFHLPVIGLLGVLHLSHWPRAAAAVVGLWLLAELSWRRLEEPILRFGRRQRYDRPEV